MKDRQFLSGFMWKFIVVDEGHRLKNLDCKWVMGIAHIFMLTRSQDSFGS